MSEAAKRMPDSFVDNALKNIITKLHFADIYQNVCDIEWFSHSMTACTRNIDR
jgi:hypothetical protein